jgi:hypothetical protein
MKKQKPQHTEQAAAVPSFSLAEIKSAFAERIKRLTCPACSEHFSDAAVEWGNAWYEGYGDRIRESGYDLRDGPFKLKCELCDCRSWYSAFSNEVKLVDQKIKTIPEKFGGEKR